MTHAETRYRREGLRALQVLLDEVGLAVLTSGKSQRVAGGVMRLATRKARVIRDIKSGKLIRVPATVRLVWSGPRIDREGLSLPRQSKRATRIASEARKLRNRH